MSPTFEEMVQAEYARICEREAQKHAIAMQAASVRRERAEEAETAMDKRIENLEALRELAGYDYEAACHAQDHKRMKTALRELITLDNQIESAIVKRDKARSVMYT